MADAAAATDASRNRAAPASRAARYRWVVLAAATFAQAASCFFVQGIGALSLELRGALGVDATRLGLLLAAAQLVPLVGLAAAGELLDRYDERWVVGVGGFVIAGGLGFAAVVPRYVPLLIALLVVGAGYSTVQPGGSKSVAGWFGPTQRGLALGVRQAGLPLGGAVAAAVLPAVADAGGVRAALLTGLLTALLGAVVFMTVYRRPVDRAVAGPTRDTPNRSTPTRDTPTRARDTPTLPRITRRSLLRDPTLAKLILSGMCMVSVHTGVAMFAVLYLHVAASVPAGSAALVFVGVQLAGAGGRIALAAWTDRRAGGRHGTVTAAMASVVAGMVVLATPAGHLAVVAVPTFLWLGFFGIGWYGPWVAALTEAAPPDRAGFVLGSVMAVNQIAVVAAPPLLGLLNDASGSFAPVWVVLAAVTASAVVVSRRCFRG